MNTSIYSSSNEMGLLRSLGPFRTLTSIGPLTGVWTTSPILVAVPMLTNTVLVYGPPNKAKLESQPSEVAELEDDGESIDEA